MDKPNKVVCGVVLALLLAIPARADDLKLPLPPSNFAFQDRWSLGLTLGEPTGVVLKRHLGNGQAWDLGIGGGPGLRVYGDYLWTLASITPQNSGLNFRIQLGGGAFVGVLSGWCSFYGKFDGCSNDPYVGVRVPFEVEMWPARAPLNFGIEIAPGLAAAPNRFGGLVDANLFVRFLLN
ncbi:MAG: hypothetical protein JST92_11605 [Deltaproteobacteria bacterium]|nr:hypothetical protein [Deltaproteobacteria bacterium]